MKDGYVVESGRAAAVLNDARHPYTRALLDSVVEAGAEHLPSVDIEQRVRKVDSSAAMVDVGDGHLVRADEGAEV